MGDSRRTKSELLEEISQRRAQVAELKKREAGRQADAVVSQAAKEYEDTLINSSLDMIIAVDGERNIVEFNAAAERTFGYHREEVLGQSVNLLYAERVLGQRVHDQMLRDGKFTGEVLNQGKNVRFFLPIYPPRGSLATLRFQEPCHQ